MVHWPHGKALPYQCDWSVVSGQCLVKGYFILEVEGTVPRGCEPVKLAPCYGFSLDKGVPSMAGTGTRDSFSLTLGCCAGQECEMLH